MRSLLFSDDEIVLGFRLEAMADAGGEADADFMKSLDLEN